MSRKKAVIYCRVSTPQQHIDTQMAACQQFCDAEGLDVIAIFCEVGSGCTNADRKKLPARHQAMQYAKKHDAYLVCWDYERLSRELVKDWPSILRWLYDRNRILWAEPGWQHRCRPNFSTPWFNTIMAA